MPVPAGVGDDGWRRRATPAPVRPDTPADFSQQALVGVGMTASGRTSVSDNIGGAVAALVGSSNRGINGQHIEASGGVMIRLSRAAGTY